MKTLSENFYERGKSEVKYCRRRIPQALLPAYGPKQTHITVSLGTSDLRIGKERLYAEMVRIDAEFARLTAELKKRDEARVRKRLECLSDEQLKAMADHWVRQVLLTDQHRRNEGIDDDEFDELNGQLLQQRTELGRMLATGRSDKILPAMNGFIHLCGLDIEMSPEQSKKAGMVFLSAVVTGLDHRLDRQAGRLVNTELVAPSAPTPKDIGVPDPNAPPSDVLGWDDAFAVWRDYVQDRPKSTAIATQTPWRELQRLATANGVTSPGDVTSTVMNMFVDEMSHRGLAVVTLNERLAKVKSVYKILKAKEKISVNPAANTIGKKQNGFAKREKRRLPFDQADLTKIFSSPIFNEQQLRSQGQAGEASYWIPLMMYYSGARTEELAGLALADLVCDPVHGWYFNIIDRPSQDDDLFDDELPSEQDSEQRAQWRTLKNEKSIRKIPVAPQLIELGLLRYIDWVRERGGVSFFPSLNHDWHNKLSGAFSKFFGRYRKQILGIDNPKKVLYSFRHTMKDAMTRVRVESKYLKRILGHASGEGVVTDGYGSEDVPLAEVMAEFSKVKFFPIDAKPWQLGKGYVKYPKSPRKAL